MSVVLPHPKTNDPWTVHEEFLKEGRQIFEVDRLDLKTPVFIDKIRFVCIADTHNILGKILEKIPPGDVLLHAGDSTITGAAKEIMEFNRDLGKLPHKYKIVIAGNHEFGFEPDRSEYRIDELSKYGVESPKELLTNCRYLEDDEITVYGYRIYGSPWHPMEGYPFALPRGQKLLEKWNKIPANIDILLTHTPPLMHGDFSNPKFRSPNSLCGCVELLNCVEQRIKPKYHVFGHIHPKNGVTSNGVTTFINASICYGYDEDRYNPIIFDLPLKDGVVK